MYFFSITILCYFQDSSHRIVWLVLVGVGSMFWNRSAEENFFQAEIDVENLSILWKFSGLHFFPLFVRDHFLSWDWKRTIMSWICISRWFFKVAIDSQGCKDRGKTIFADTVEGQWLHHSSRRSAAEAHAMTAELKPKSEALGWKMAPLLLGCERVLLCH